MTLDYLFGILGSLCLLSCCLYTTIKRLPKSTLVHPLKKHLRKLYNLHINLTYVALFFLLIHTKLNYSGIKLSPNYVALGCLLGLSITGLLLKYRKSSRHLREWILISHIMLTILLILAAILHLIITFTMGYH